MKTVAVNLDSPPLIKYTISAFPSDIRIIKKTFNKSYIKKLIIGLRTRNKDEKNPLKRGLKPKNYIV